MDLCDKLTLLQATEEMFRMTPDYVPLYYVRMVDAMYSLVLKHELDVNVSVSSVDDDDSHLQVRLADLMADEFQIVVPERAREFARIVGDLRKVNENEPQNEPQNVRRIEVARRFKAYELRRLFVNFSEVNPFPDEGCYGPRLQYTCTFEDFLRICIASGFPLPRECLELLEEDATKQEYSLCAGECRSRDSESAKLGSISLTDAILLLFGQIGKNRRWEALVEHEYLRNLLPCSGKKFLERLSCREKDIARTHEFRLAVQAIDSGALNALRSSMDPSVHLVELKALAAWALKHGLPLSGRWMEILEAEAEAEVDNLKRNDKGTSESEIEQDPPIAPDIFESECATTSGNLMSLRGRTCHIQYNGVSYHYKRLQGHGVILELIGNPGKEYGCWELVEIVDRSWNPSLKKGTVVQPVPDDLNKPKRDDSDGPDDYDNYEYSGDSDDLKNCDKYEKNDQYKSNITYTSDPDELDPQRIREHIKKLEDAARKTDEEIASLRSEGSDPTALLKNLKEIEKVIAQTRRQLEKVTKGGPSGMRFTPEVEKQRKYISKLINTAISKIQMEHPDLYNHLDSSIKTGTRCKYDPTPLVEWEIQRD